METYADLKKMSNYVRGREYKVKRADSTIPESDRRRLVNLRKCLDNIKDDGFIGGESGVSPGHLEAERTWLSEAIKRWYPDGEAVICERCGKPITGGISFVSHAPRHWGCRV